MDIKTEFVNLPVDDGSSMRAYVARPAGKARAGLIVFQEIFGINSHVRSVTERFGREGYLAIAPELFHRSGPGFESGYTDMAPAFEHMKQVTDAGLSADIRAAYDWLQKDTGGIATGAVGYCMGGRVATLAAMSGLLSCGISYYGGGIAPSQFNPGLLGRLHELKAPMLFFWGGLDSHIPQPSAQSVIDTLRAEKKPYVTVEFSDADHGFFCDERASYNAAAAAEAWPLTLAYLETHTQAAAKHGRP
jgi:carboxymethylenebutenolidase